MSKDKKDTIFLQLSFKGDFSISPLISPSHSKGDSPSFIKIFALEKSVVSVFVVCKFACDFVRNVVCDIG